MKLRKDNMRPESIKKEQAELNVYSADPQYVIIGFKSDGIRGIPATYNMVTEIAANEDEVLAIIPKLTPPFKVCKISNEGSLSWMTWDEKVKQKNGHETEKEERELLKKLKAKYEK